MNSLFPHYVGTQQAAMRGLSVGWYAMDQEGEIASGPYCGRSECVNGIAQLPIATSAPQLWRRPN